MVKDKKKVWIAILQEYLILKILALDKLPIFSSTYSFKSLFPKIPFMKFSLRIGLTSWM